MRAYRRLSVVLFSVVAATIVLAAGVASAQEAKPATAPMRGMFVVVSKVYVYSLDADIFADPGHRQEILSMLEALARNAVELEAHGGGLDPSFDFMRRSLSRDAIEALVTFRNHNYIGSRFVLSKITENCMTCHTRLPNERQFDPGKEFLDAMAVAELPPSARANLQVATRQFAEAMKTYEEVIGSRDVTATDLAMFDTFENYFRLSIGAMNDSRRPVQTLEKFIGRPDMPDATRAEARDWIGSLQALNLGAAGSDQLAAAQRIVARATEETSRSDRSHLVDFIGAIALVHRYLRSGPRNDLDIAEAYYLLGVSESHVSHSYWISETDFLLEKAVRQAPKSAVARKALAFLEEYRHSKYNVTPARAVPPELQTNIEELRKLTQQ